MPIRPYQDRDGDAVVRLSLRAWEPVFNSLSRTMDSDLYRVFYPDWRESQKSSVETTCAEESTHVWVSDEDGEPVGFVAVKLHDDGIIGEIYMIAVDPDFQRRGIASELIDFANAWIKEAGRTVAMIDTGGDPGHTPARSTYEKSGFDLFEVARYFKKL